MTKSSQIEQKTKGANTSSAMQLIHDLWYKRRDIISDGYDESLAYISKIIPMTIHKIPSGTSCWTWTVPMKWSVGEAYIEDLKGNRLLDLNDHPLHIVSNSLPKDAVVSREELLEHIHTIPQKPNAIPFEFKYYEKDWGFCVEHNRLKDFTQDQYRVFIDSKFEKGTLKVGECLVKGKTDETIVMVAHLCHPAMANDDLAGVAVLVEIAKELLQRDNYYSYKFILVPETIGSVAYLSQNEDVIPQLKYGIFLEMLGNDNNHALQFSRQGKTKIDRVAQFIMRKNLKSHREGSFRQIVANDEMVFNGPGVNIPTISISRYPFEEYHTSDDNVDIISKERLEESKRLVLAMVRILEKDYIPKRTFKGPVFLSKYGLWVDWRTDKELNANIEQIMLLLEGDLSVFDIAEKLDMDFDVVLDYINRFYEEGLVERIVCV